MLVCRTACFHSCVLIIAIQQQHMFRSLLALQEATQKFQALQRIYEVLSDPAK
jgi:hypothetical protein